MDALFAMQADLLKQINNSFRNFQKKGAARMNKFTASARLAGIDDCYAQYKVNHSRILSTKDVPRDHEYFATSLSEQIIDAYFDRKGDFLQFIADATQLEREQEVVVPSDENQNAHNNTLGPAASESQSLPKITIPKFSGKFSEWENFRDLFRSVVHRRTDLDSSIKFYYLRTNLTGEALETIKSIPLSADNYENAWTALREIYDNTRKAVNTLVATIFNVKPMQHENQSELKRVEREFFGPLESLRMLNRDDSQIGNDLLVYRLTELFDPSTKKEWKKTIDKNTDVPPTIEQLKVFIKGQVENLDDGKLVPVESSTNNSQTSGKGKGKRQAKGESEMNSVHSLLTSSNDSNSTSTPITCILCKGEHLLAKCEQFAKQSVADRREFARTKRICFNCLSSGHSKNHCKSRFNCFVCKARHHTRLHPETIAIPASSTPDPIVSTASTNVNTTNLSSAVVSSSSHTTHVEKETGILLATALLRVVGSKGKQMLVKALIDPCSQVSLITENLCNQLGLPQKETHIRVQGVGEGTPQLANKMATFDLTPHFDSKFKLTATALVLTKLSSYRPPKVWLPQTFNHLNNLQLADPSFLEQVPIQLLLGAEVYTDVVEEAIIRGSVLQPIAICSKFGWLITGKCSTDGTNSQTQSCTISVHHCSSEEDTDARLVDLLQEFWKVEEVDLDKNSCSASDRACEELFTTTTRRDESGRYFVNLPWKNESYARNAKIGNSFMYASSALKRLESHFVKDRKLEIEYKKFIKEYQELEHMTLVTDAEPSSKLNHFFLPHHGVWKESSSTTKLRTVFNGSSKFNASESLNDLLHSGPNLLKNPVSLVCSIRHYRYALSADLEKMFRMIGVNAQEKRFQTILWRWKSSEKLQMHLLNTITYGLTCALYLAIRVLLQIAQDYEQEYPLASKIIQDEMYSDNVLSGAHTLQEARQKMYELITVFEKAQMNLRKWASNEPLILDSLPDCKLAENKITMFDANSTMPMLGIAWHASGDYYCFHLEDAAVINPITKRRVLSRIARIFDPLGWISPVVITAKILLQTLWLLKLGWDDPLPSTISQNWVRWVETLPAISSIKIPRWTGYDRETAVEIHGFADASKLAYGAVIYVRLLKGDSVSTSLQLAKSKVAPVKTLSIPRLELCAALLLTRTVKQYVSAIKFEIKDVHLWTDSADVLFWLRDQPSRWNVFVANRCSEIHTSLPHAYWHHVKSADNPADAVSRGIEPSSLQNLDLWWKGASFLTKEPTPWPKSQDELNFSVNSLAIITSFNHQCAQAIETTAEPNWVPLERYSTLSKVTRVTAYCLRFIAKVSYKLSQNVNSSYEIIRLPFVMNCTETHDRILSAAELSNAELFCCLLTQRSFFKVEYTVLAAGKQLNSKHPFASLNPVLKTQLIRVGGRLANAQIPEENKNPVILPRSSFLTTLLIRDAHKQTLHGGTRLTLATLRQRVWIVRGRTEVKRVIRECVICTRYAARIPQQMMGDLPDARVQPAKPFVKSGVDYAGPFKVRLTKTRGKGTLKSYACVFVCMVTKAVHLELAEDCTSDAFIAAFHRFTARRGHCRDLYSDNGTNFVGADAQLKTMLQQADGHQADTITRLAETGTNWHFNPPSAPHFGGLWEAAVKSLKFHLRRVIGEQILTFSEFSTLLCRIEACLNSRPLIDISDDPSDLSILTPAHFLIQRSSYLVPEQNFVDLNIPIGKRWQLLSQATQQFWIRWRDEYLSALQKRNKWVQPRPSPTIGDLVLIRNELTPPGQWPLAKIIDLHPGKDGKTRVVTVRTSSGNYRRPIIKLVFLRPS